MHTYRHYGQYTVERVPYSLLFWVLLNSVALLPCSNLEIVDFVNCINPLIAFLIFSSRKLTIKYIITTIFIIDLLSNYKVGLMTLEYYLALVTLRNFCNFAHKKQFYHSVVAYATFIMILYIIKYSLFYIMGYRAFEVLWINETIPSLIYFTLVQIFQKYFIRDNLCEIREFSISAQYKYIVT